MSEMQSTMCKNSMPLSDCNAPIGRGSAAAAGDHSEAECHE